MKAWIPLLETQINDLNLPNIAVLLQNIPSKSCWEKCVTKILGTRPVEPGGDKMRPRTAIHVCSKLLPLSALESDPLH